MDEIRWGMIGCGDVAERKSGPAFNLLPHSSLVAVAATSTERAENYARRHGIPKWYGDGSLVIDDPDVNAVYIATPPDSHASFTIRAAQAGKPVYVEKPMARTFAECQAMIAACRQSGVPLFVAYYRRCLPAFSKIKELIESEAIGAVRCITIRLFSPPHPQDLDRDHLPWRVRPEKSGGGYLYDLASHQLDFLDYVFGPVSSAAGQTANQAGLYPAEDMVAASWAHTSGVIGSGTWCFTAAPGQAVEEAEIVGSRGRIGFSFFDQGPVRLETSEGVEEFVFSRNDPIQLPLIQLVIDDLRGAGVCPSTGISAARTNWVLEKIVNQSISQSVNSQSASRE